MNKNYRYFVSYLKNYKNQNLKVLDFGAGKGILLQLLLDNNFDAYGIDINHTNNMTKYLDNNLITQKKLILLKQGEKLPFADNTFDVIVSNMVFEHVHNIEDVLLELKRILKKSGRIYLRFPSYEVIREGHTGIPLSHKIKNSKKLKIYMHIAYFLGLGTNRKMHGNRSMWVNHKCEYLKTKTVYRTYKDLLKIFRDFNIDHKEIEFLKFYFENKKIILLILNSPLKHILIYLYKKYTTMDIELTEKL